MTLHPDIITDLVILYHAGEASQASRSFLEEEARANAQLASALAATPRAMTPFPQASVFNEGKTFRKVRLRYQVIAFAAVWCLSFVLIAMGSFFVAAPPGSVGLIATLVPLLFLVLFFVGAVGALYFFVRAVRR